MSNEKQAFSKALEEALNKSVEANKVFLNESSKFFQQIGKQDGTKRFNFLKGETLSNTFGEYMKLNLEHFNNLVDLGVSFMRTVNNSAATDSDNHPSEETPADQPSFVLEKETPAGQQVRFQFLLDNIKQEAVACQLVHTGFTGPARDEVLQRFRMDFTPPVFTLNAGESHSIDIVVDIPADAAPGLYTTRVQVKGFEPAHFSVQLTVIESPTQPGTDGGKEKKSKRK
ncbi:hypothetical protein LZZ85_03930 [Terrimonas sp. NA20]|uniref:DUF1573 domain-containing protein n=1 Tax=Terrimonas ginsenosidimutans TaxID=2908004 RepID=A0ABS9KM62_9BACT|nr:hypothetical protein [Terrimonas ginsenosidimutans]MCG2613411.1 hypothetical protein [Terrimonas ginsenosidimutans]